MAELRRTGLDKMNHVYAWEMPDMPGDYFALTVDHLFSRIRTREGLSMRDRRMMVIAVVTALGLDDLLEVQVNAVLQNGELTEAELSEMAVFITHYVGFPLGSRLNGVISRVVGRRAKAAAAGNADDKRTNANAVVTKDAGQGLD